MPENARLEGSAIAISFWLGGCGLLGLKAGAYALSGSALVRTSMFESIGDVVSSAVLQITQWKVADLSDRNQYPTGKQRLVPLGILFFCAFMTSAMVNMAIEQVSTLFTVEETEVNASEILHRVFDEHPRLRLGLWPRKVGDVVSAYAGDNTIDESSDNMAAILMGICVLVKGICFAWCSYATCVTGSEVSKVLGADHRNDIFANSLVILVMCAVTALEARGYNQFLLSKIDPFASLLLSLWIIWGWVDNGLEQIGILSNRRVDGEDTEKVKEVASKYLESTEFRLLEIDVYHSGQDFEARLTITPATPAGAKLEVGKISTILHALEAAICEGDCGVLQAHAKLDLPKSGSAKNCDNLSWVGGYVVP